MAKYISKLINGEELYYLKDSEARENLIDKTEKGAASGVATLDANGKISSEQIPTVISDSASISYGTCYTESNIQNKVVQLSNTNWSLKVGSVVGVKFFNTNTFVAEEGSEITLNINGTGAKQIWYNTGANPTGTMPSVYGFANKYTFYMYDGTYWVWMNHGTDLDTTYQNMTASEIQTGTDQNARSISAKTLNDWIDGKGFLTQHQDISGKADQSDLNSLEESISINGVLGTTITSAERSAWNAKVDSSSVGVANGVASLGSDGKVPSTQLPSYVDDVLEYETASSFPAEGESGKIYVDKSNNTTWRWSGSAYTQIKGDLVIGTTAGTACEGNDPRLFDSRPASDVSAWAKASNKPVYSPSEVGFISSVIETNTNKNNQTAPESVTGATNNGKNAHVIYQNTGSENYTIAISTTSGYITPDGQAMEITCPQNGYCEISYLNIGGTIYVRGL